MLRHWPDLCHAFLSQDCEQKSREHWRKLNKKIQNLNNIIRLFYKGDVQRANDLAVDDQGQGNSCVKAH